MPHVCLPEAVHDLMGFAGIDRDISSGAWDDAKKNVASLTQACGGCHTPYRERFDDGSFRAKIREKTPGR